MVTAVRREDLVAPGVQARHAHRVLDRFGPTVGEEDLGGAVKGVIQNQLGGAIARLVAVLGRDRAQHARLLLDGAHHRGVLVADVGVDQLGREVQIGGVVNVSDVDALARL